MDEILGIARIRIHEGKLDEYKKLAAEFMERARTKDTGTLQYDLFFNDDNSECVVIERYRNSEALLQHSANQGDRTAELLKICTISGEVCGFPSPELKSPLESYGVPVFSSHMSLRFDRFRLSARTNAVTAAYDPSIGILVRRQPTPYTTQLGFTVL